MTLFIAPNGEIVELGTGIVQGLENTIFPPLSTDAQSLLRHFDGVSAEPLGSVSKIITISREEQKLLSRLRPWKWFKYATRMDYFHLINKLNRHKLSMNLSIIMKNMWADPNSVFNSPEYRASLRGPRGPSPHSSLMMTERWNDQSFRDKMIKILCDRTQTDEWRSFVSDQFTKLWADPVYKAKRIADFLISNSDNAKKGWKTRFKNYPMLYKDPETTHKRMSEAQKKTAKERWQKRVVLYGPTGVKNPELTNKRKKESWAWRKCALVLKMIFGSI